MSFSSNKNFIFKDGKIITCEYGRNILIGNKKLMNQFTFSVSLASQTPGFSIGITNHQKIIFYNLEGSLFTDQTEIKSHVQKIKIGDKIEIVGNISQGLFKIKINNKEIYTYTWTEIKGNDQNWFPKIYTLGKNINIEVLEYNGEEN